jgi:hypothetical protein
VRAHIGDGVVRAGLAPDDEDPPPVELNGAFLTRRERVCVEKNVPHCVADPAAARWARDSGCGKP